MMRVIILGFDGATFDVIRPLAGAGALPNLERLAAGGASGPLRSTIHPITPAAWTSSFTGLNPGRHGVYSFEALRRYSYALQPVNARRRHGPTLWQVLSEHGRRVGVFNVPLTYPPDPVNGFMVSGMDAPSTRAPFTFPKNLAEPLLAAVPGYQIDFSDDRQGDLDDYCENVLAAFDAHLRAFDYLTERYAPLDFVMAVFVAADRLQHMIWHYWDPAAPTYHNPAAPRYREYLRQAYRRFDALVGRLLDGLDDETLLVVMSDHGFGPARKHVRMNRWLAEQGLLTFFPIQVKHKFPAPIDWGKTQAWSYGLFGDIRVNLRGREPLGTVAPGPEYEKLRETLCRELSALSDPDAGPVVERVWLREELYHGPYLEQAPDVTPLFRDYAYLGRDSYRGLGDPIFEACDAQHTDGRLFRSGIHRLDGVLYAYGRGVPRGLQVREAQIADLTPTVLAWLNVEPAAPLDGKPLPIFEPDRAHPARGLPAPPPAASTGAASAEAARRELEIAELRETVRYLTARVGALERAVVETEEAFGRLEGWSRELQAALARRDAELARVKRFLPVRIARALLRVRRPPK